MNLTMENNMELDELKSAWQTLDRRLEQQGALNQRLLRESTLERVRRGLRPLFWGQIAQIAIGVASVMLGLSFWTRHRDVVHLFVAGLSLHVYGVIAIMFAGVALSRIAAIDHAAPVVQIQKQLGQLRRLYIINGLCVGLTWWLLWIPLAMVLLGSSVDIYAHAPSVVWINLGVGVIGLALSVWLLQWARDPRRPILAGKVEAGLSGSSLTRVTRFLDEIEQFEKS